MARWSSTRLDSFWRNLKIDMESESVRIRIRDPKSGKMVTLLVDEILEMRKKEVEPMMEVIDSLPKDLRDELNYSETREDHEELLRDVLKMASMFGIQKLKDIWNKS